MMNKKTSIILVLVFVIGLLPGVTKAKLVACVGDSITYGYGISNRNDNSYPAQLVGILPMLQGFDSEWETQNFGHSGATLLSNFVRSYVTKTAYTRALESEPDVVVIMLGSNDSALATISQIEQDFIPDYLALIDAFAQLPSRPRIFVCYPPPIFGGSYGSDNTIRNIIIPLIDQLPTHRDVEVIDMYTPLEECGHLFPDNLHPNAEGAGIIAETVAKAILGFRFLPEFNGDGKIDIEDLMKLIEHWGQDEPALDITPPPSGDGLLGRADLEVLMTYWEREVIDPTLIAHWALDETEGILAANSVGVNDAVVIGGYEWQPNGGQVDGALKLDGVDGYAIAGAVLNPADGPFSVLAWINGGESGQVVASQQFASNWLAIDTEGNLMTELKGAGRSTGPLFSEAVITDGQWHRIGLVWDGSNRTLYVDGVAVAEGSQPELESSQMGLYIGTGKAMEPGTYFSGLIDEIRIFNRAVSP